MVRLRWATRWALYTGCGSVAELGARHHRIGLDAPSNSLVLAAYCAVPALQRHRAQQRGVGNRAALVASKTRTHCTWPTRTGPNRSHRQWGLTPRSTGAATEGHQGPVCGTRCIFTARALASCRCRPVSSNVRLHKLQHLHSAIAQLPHAMQMQFIGFGQRQASPATGTACAAAVNQKAMNRSASRRAVVEPLSAFMKISSWRRRR